MKAAEIDRRTWQHFAQRLDARGVPEHLHEGILMWLCAGILPGHFLRAVLNNEFVEVMRRSDETSRAGLPALAEFMHYDMPAQAWGNHGRVLQWQETFITSSGSPRSVWESI